MKLRQHFSRFVPRRRRTQSGFTIVELLIVIVVIAILAAVSVVAYNGAQQRAKNARTIAAAEQIVKAMALYIADGNTLPAASRCIIPDDDGVCRVGSTTYTKDSAFNTALKQLSSLPSAVPAVTSSYQGVVLGYNADRTFNGEARPWRLNYSLMGTSQNCSLPNVANSKNNTMTTSTTGYTIADVDGTGSTACVIVITTPT